MESYKNPVLSLYFYGLRGSYEIMSLQRSTIVQELGTCAPAGHDKQKLNPIEALRKQQKE